MRHVFVVQASLTAFVAGVCAAALLSGRGEPAAYLPVLAGLLGYWLPAPRPPPPPEQTAESASYAPTPTPTPTPGSPVASPRSHPLALDSSAETT